MPSLSRTMTSLRRFRSQMAVTNIPRSCSDELIPPLLVGVDDGLGVGPRPEHDGPAPSSSTLSSGKL